MKDSLPDQDGFFGEYGGKFVPETLMFALDELEQTYKTLKDNNDFNAEFHRDLAEFVGRPSPLYFAKRLTEHFSTASIWLKREDLNHTGAHKINNTVGQILLAKYMGKKRIIAETGAGQHGVATATVAARLGLDCHIYMGSEDVRRQSLNVYRMKLLGAKVHEVNSGSATLKDALNEALRDWVTNIEDTYYIIGSVTGPHPYPMLVRDFQSVIGKETKYQFKNCTGNENPDILLACVGGGSNALGLFFPYLNDDVKMVGVEAGGKGLDTGNHAATLSKGEFGVSNDWILTQLNIHMQDYQPGDHVIVQTTQAGRYWYFEKKPYVSNPFGMRDNMVERGIVTKKEHEAMRSYITHLHTETKDNLRQQAYYAYLNTMRWVLGTIKSTCISYQALINPHSFPLL